MFTDNCSVTTLNRLCSDSFADFGCMVEVSENRYNRDGSSTVNAVGRRRFQVLSRSRRDGYHTAKVKFYTDNYMVRSAHDKGKQFYFYGGRGRGTCTVRLCI